MRRLFGIPVHIDPSWFFVIAFLTWSLSRGYFPAHQPGLRPATYALLGFAAALLLFLCVLLHELGHSLTARRFGIPVARLVLFMFGGVAELSAAPKRPMVELAVALAGPVVSGLLAVVCWLAADLLPPSAAAGTAALLLRYLAVINTGIILFNLLPGFPLDGGRVLRAALWAWTGSLPRATRIVSTLGAALGVLLIVLGAWVLARGAWFSGGWYILLGFFLRDAALLSLRQASHGGV
jgi:Zn-dependent protease